MSWQIWQTCLICLTFLPSWKNCGCQMVTHLCIAQANSCLILLIWPLSLTALPVHSYLYCASLRHLTGGSYYSSRSRISCTVGVNLIGGIDSWGGYVSKSLYVKMKESGPLGGMHRACPSRSAFVKKVKVHCLPTLVMANTCTIQA